ncbi:MAG: hypothetical protein H7833_19660 [Magnetococcus sp. DMHC-1]|nr:folate-binding protein YgfZ [Magnetococcales bacterium]
MSLLRHHLAPGIPWCDDRGQPTPERFAPDLNTELHALQNGTALVDLTHCGVVTLTGPERLQFLGGLVTNQVRDITESRSIHAAMLTPQGRFFRDFTLVQAGESLHLLTEPDQVARFLERLYMYRLRAKVEMTLTSATLGVLALAGPEAGHLLAGVFPGLDPNAPPGTTCSPTATLRLWRDPRHTALGWRLLVPATELPTIWDQLAALATPVGVTAWETHRIHHALPRGGVDFIPDETLLLECGGKELNTVSFTKGCYIGQETTARTHSRGTIKKRLHQLRVPGDINLVPQTPVFTPDGKEAGIVTSCTRLEDVNLALAILRRADVLEHPFLTVAGLRATALVPAWATWE